MYMSICWYLSILPVLYRPDVVDIGANTIGKHALCQRDNRIQSFLSIQYVNGDLCKHLGIDLSIDQIHIIGISTRSIPKCLHKLPCACQILRNVEL